VGDENDEDEPERVSPVMNQEHVSRGHMQHVFPHESVTVITLRTTAAK
jgi:alpha-N-arabinofuranosidase